MTGRLHGKVALITGSDSGIGQATAIAFAKEGADVVVHYLEDEDGAGHTREAVESAGRRAIVVQADITDEQQVEALFQAANEPSKGAGGHLNGCPSTDTSTPPPWKSVNASRRRSARAQRSFARGGRPLLGS